MIEKRVRMRQRGDTAANWASKNPTLLLGEIGYESDTKKGKFGDGVTAWNDLGYSWADATATVEAAQAAQSAAEAARDAVYLRGYATLADLQADLAPNDGALAEVTNDPTVDNNWVYRKSGASGVGSWVKASTDRIEAVEAGVAILEGQQNPGSRDPLLLAFDQERFAANVYSSDRIASTFAGWASAFTYEGEAIDVVQVYVQIDDPDGVEARLSIRLADLTTVLATTTRKLYASGYHLFVMPRRLTATDITDAVFWVSVEAVGHTKTLRAPTSNVTGDRNADGVSYIPKYTTIGSPDGDGWVDASAQSSNVLVAAFYDSTVDAVPASERLGRLAAIEKIPIADSFKLDKVSYDSAEDVVVASGTSGFPRALVFCGFGSKYNNIGVWTANLARIPNLPRSTPSKKWATITVEVRDGGPTGTLVATGTANVNTDVAPLSGLEIALTDPATGAPKAIADTDFGAAYFIGYSAKDVDGNFADCGESRGTIAIYEGNSYYRTSSTGGWADYSGDECIAIELLNAVALETTTAHQLKPDALPGAGVALEHLDAVLAPQMRSGLDIVLPPVIYAVVGHEMSVYFDNLVRSMEGLNIDVACSVGTHQSERWTLNAADPVTTSLTLTGYGRHGETALGSKTADLIVKGSTVGSGITKKCLFIGDSTTAAGAYTGELVTLFGVDAMDISLAGTKGSAPNLHEGISGWTVAKFYADATSPFVFSGVFDFAQYLSTNGLNTPDYVFFNLGINDLFSKTSDSEVDGSMSTMISQLEAMATDIHAVSAAIKIGMMVTIPPASSQDPFGANYSSGQTLWRYKRNILLWARKLIDTFASREGSGFFLVPLNCNIDTVHNFPVAAAAAANSRTVTQIVRQNNGVHPATEGYYQMADTIYAFLKGQES
jgi:hypothetical protein